MELVYCRGDKIDVSCIDQVPQKCFPSIDGGDTFIQDRGLGLTVCYFFYFVCSLPFLLRCKTEQMDVYGCLTLRLKQVTRTCLQMQRCLSQNPCSFVNKLAGKSFQNTLLHWLIFCCGHPRCTSHACVMFQIIFTAGEIMYFCMSSHSVVQSLHAEELHSLPWLLSRCYILYGDLRGNSKM